MKTLTQVEAFVLSKFDSFKKCPSMLELSKKVKLSPEYTRRIMWSLVAKKYIAVNKKLKARKFYVKG
jgi:hypothetical protein